MTGGYGRPDTGTAVNTTASSVSLKKGASQFYSHDDGRSVVPVGYSPEAGRYARVLARENGIGSAINIAYSIMYSTVPSVNYF